MTRVQPNAALIAWVFGPEEDKHAFIEDRDIPGVDFQLGRQAEEWAHRQSKKAPFKPEPGYTLRGAAPFEMLVDLGGSDLTAAHYQAVIESGVHVISGNTQAVSDGLPDLPHTAASRRAIFDFNACIGGRAPILTTIRRARLAAPIVRIDAILPRPAKLEESSSPDFARACLRLMAFAGFGALLDDLEIAVPDTAAATSSVFQVAHIEQARGRFGAHVSLTSAGELRGLHASPGDSAAMIETADGREWRAAPPGEAKPHDLIAEAVTAAIEAISAD